MELLGCWRVGGGIKLCCVFWLMKAADREWGKEVVRLRHHSLETQAKWSSAPQGRGSPLADGTADSASPSEFYLSTGKRWGKGDTGKWKWRAGRFAASMCLYVYNAVSFKATFIQIDSRTLSCEVWKHGQQWQIFLASLPKPNPNPNSHLPRTTIKLGNPEKKMFIHTFKEILDRMWILPQPLQSYE